ncbi:MAG: hypothetical protein AAFZ01_08055 [Pseudomonadota bacterium]
MRVLIIIFLVLAGFPAVFFAGVYYSPWVQTRLAQEGYVLPICAGLPEIRNADTLRCGFRKVELDFDAPERRSTRNCPNAAIDPQRAENWLRATLIRADRDGATIRVWVSDHVRSRNEFRGALYVNGKPLRTAIIAAKLACSNDAPRSGRDWCATTYEAVCASG